MNFYYRMLRHQYNAFNYNNISPLYDDMRLYGWTSFKVEILGYALGREIANKQEMKLIVQHESHISLNGYNKTYGGGGIKGLKRSEETKRAISEKNKKPLEINGSVYESVTSAIHELKISRNTLRNRLKSFDYPKYKYI